jgi:hypothetical protein
VTCRHDNADHLMPGQFTMLESGALITAACEQLRCVDCGEMLSLGPANDAGCAVEIRAAEIAADGERGHCSDDTMEWDCERCGWLDWGVNNVPAGNRWHAGYLARVIAEHGDQA